MRSSPSPRSLWKEAFYPKFSYPVSGPRQLPRHESQENEDIGDDEDGDTAADDATALIGIDIYSGMV